MADLKLVKNGEGGNLLRVSVFIFSFDDNHDSHQEFDILKTIYYSTNPFWKCFNKLYARDKVTRQKTKKTEHTS